MDTSTHKYNDLTDEQVFSLHFPHLDYDTIILKFQDLDIHEVIEELKELAYRMGEFIIERIYTSIYRVKLFSYYRSAVIWRLFAVG